MSGNPEEHRALQREQAMTGGPGSKPRGVLEIWRARGKGMFIGRDVRVTVLDFTPRTVRLAVEAPISLVVSGGEVSHEEHLERQLDRESRPAVSEKDLTTVVLLLAQPLRIGRQATLTYTGPRDSHAASIAIEAPTKVAVTRDDFTFEEHLVEQKRRERGERPVAP